MDSLLNHREELLAAMEQNMVVHMSYFQTLHPAMRVELRDDLIVVDSGLPCDTFNFICRARLSETDAPRRIQEIVRYFQQVSRPFSWWVGACDRPVTLPKLLANAGLSATESEVGMVMDLTQLPAIATHPSELRVDRVSSESQLADFASVIAANWEPPDRNAHAFYENVSTLALSVDCPMHFYVGYVGDRPVSSSELCIGGVAGLYSIATVVSERGKGYGTALTLRALYDARKQGISVATLQASAEGQNLYTRIGFTPTCHFTEFH